MSLRGSSVSSVVGRCAMSKALCGKSSPGPTYPRNARRINAPRKRHTLRARDGYENFTAGSGRYITQRRKIYESRAGTCADRQISRSYRHFCFVGTVRRASRKKRLENPCDTVSRIVNFFFIALLHYIIT